jgi:hypothetical protein
MLPALAHLFELMRSTANMPASWKQGKLVPLHKRADECDPANYRPLVVSNALYSMYTRVLLSRLRNFIDDKLPDCLFGFRPHRGTTSCHYILMTLMQAARNKALPQGMYAAAMDLNKAYDNVHRELLWQQLDSIGCSQHFVKIIKDIYSDTAYVVRLHDHMCTPFSSSLGLKQGCPLSPTLFNVYVHKLPGLVQSLCPNVGVFMPTNQQQARVQVLMYADDILLLAHKHHDMQHLINALQATCSQLQLSISPTKCEVWHVSRPGQPVRTHAPFECGGHMLHVNTEVKYLGHKFADKFKAADLCEQRITKGRSSLPPLLGMIKQRGIAAQPKLVKTLYHALYLPILTFGCELWGPEAILARDFTDTPLQSAANAFLKGGHRLPDSCPTWPMLYFLDIDPVHKFVLHRACAVWDEMQRTGSPLVHAAMVTQQHMHRQHAGTCWLSHLHAALVPLSEQAAAALVEPPCVSRPLAKQFECVPAPCIDTHYDAATEQYHEDPRNEHCHHRMHARYFHWFMSVNTSEPFAAFINGYVTGQPVSSSVRKDLCAFVLGSRLLAANAQSRREGNTTVHIPYHDRVCTLCHGSAGDGTVAQVQDELHVLFECPGLQDIRTKYLHTCLHAHDVSDDAAVRIAKLFDHSDAFHYVHDIMSVLRDTRSQSLNQAGGGP